MKRTLFWISTGLVFFALATGRHAQAQTAAGPDSTTSAAAAHAVDLPGTAIRTMDSTPLLSRAFTGASSAKFALLIPAGYRELLERLVITGLVVIATILILLGLRRLKRRATLSLEKRRERIRPLRFRGLELLSASTLFSNFRRLVHGLYLLCFGVVVLAAALIIFGQFPATRGYARQVVLWLWNPLVLIFKGALGYLPNLFYILVIVVVARFIVRMIDYVFAAAERGLISLEPWIHRDVARPTGLIIKVTVIVVTLFFIAPLIPGTGSTAAKGISIILGLMISFGSTSTVGNFVAGIVLMYMRPFQLGERVRIGDTTGDVIERTFLYTKVVTIKNEEVILPSLMALGSPMTNYSARARTEGLILHTSVTIGYDAPWRKVHELLLRAAERTSHVLKDPKPFVFQTALDDFYVNYQLNVYTNQASRMAQIYSELHQNIQDSFNEGGVEICSPHFRQVRDGNTVTIPAEYREKDYKAPRFQVETYAAPTGS